MDGTDRNLRREGRGLRRGHGIHLRRRRGSALEISQLSICGGAVGLLRVHRVTALKIVRVKQIQDGFTFVLANGGGLDHIKSVTTS